MARGWKCKLIIKILLISLLFQYKLQNLLLVRLTRLSWTHICFFCSLLQKHNSFPPEEPSAEQKVRSPSVQQLPFSILSKNTSLALTSSCRQWLSTLPTCTQRFQWCSLFHESISFNSIKFSNLFLIIMKFWLKKPYLVTYFSSVLMPTNGNLWKPHILKARPKNPIRHVLWSAFAYFTSSSSSRGTPTWTIKNGPAWNSRE